MPGPSNDYDGSGNNPNKPTIVSITPMKKGHDIYEIEFQIAASGGTTSYTNPGGTGDRTAIITITGTMSFDVGASSSTANASHLINGNVTETGFTFTDLSATTNTIRFDFGTAKVIDQIRWKQADSQDYGMFILECSTDGTTWVNLGRTNLGGAKTQTYQTLAGTTAYRYWRLTQDKTDSIFLTRSYVYTWVNEFGEESSPSLPVTGAGNASAIWTIGNIVDPPAPTTTPLQPAWKEKRLYRTITGASGQTTFYRVVNVVALGALTVYDDDGTEGHRRGDRQQPAAAEITTWAGAVPPATLKGWIAMPNGFLAGFDGSNIYFSEPYRWHAWPAEYKQATETPVVGLGILGQTCVVCTQGYPSTITGVQPATCSFTKSTTGEPCMSRGSIVSTPDGVIYASQNGLIIVGPGGIQNVTKDLITRDVWIKDYAPQYLRAVRYQEGYLAVRMPPLPSPRSGFFLDPTALKVALTEMSEFAAVRNLNNDFWSGEVFVILDGMIQRWDPPTNDLMPVQWRSKEFQFQYQENFGAYSIYWDDARYIELQLRHLDHADDRTRPLPGLRQPHPGLRRRGAVQRPRGAAAVGVQVRHLAVRDPLPRAGLHDAGRLNREGAERCLDAGRRHRSRNPTPTSCRCAPASWR